MGIERRLLWLSRVAAWAVLALAMLPLAGWLLNVPPLYQLQPTWPEMVPETLLLVLLTAGALLLKPQPPSGEGATACLRKPYWILVLLVLAISLTTLVYYLLNWGRDLYFPPLFGPKPSSPRSVLAFLVLSTVLLLACSLRHSLQNLALYLILIPFAIAMLAVIGYVSAFAAFYSTYVELGLGMSVPTALAVVMLCLSAFLGPLRHCHEGLLYSHGTGGTIVRMLVPVVLLLPPAVSLLILSFALQRNLDQPTLVAMLTLVPSLLLGALIYYSAWRLELAQRESARRKAESRQVGIALEKVEETAELDGGGVALAAHPEDPLQKVSHELRTPLTAIKSWTRLLREGGLDADQEREAHEILRAEIGRLERGVERIFGDGGRMDGPETRARGAPTEAGELAGIAILIVDDEESIRIAMKLMLQVLGARAAAAASAEAARRALRSFRPDVLLCDIGMPDEDGLTFIRKLRASGAEYARLPAIAVTAYTGEEYEAAAREAGFDALLGKPVATAHLVARLKELLGVSGAAGDADLVPESPPTS